MIEMVSNIKLNSNDKLFDDIFHIYFNYWSQRCQAIKVQFFYDVFIQFLVVVCI